MTNTMTEQTFFGRMKKTRITVDGRAGNAPLLMFHGTSRHFETYDMNRVGQEQYSDWGHGIYLTPHRHTAEYYSIEAQCNQDPLCESLWKQYELQETNEILDRFRYARRQVRENATPVVMQWYVNMVNPFVCAYQSSANPGVGVTARDGGYDGVVLLNPAGYIDEVVAFSPEQLIAASAVQRPWRLETLNVQSAELEQNEMSSDFNLLPT